MVATVSTITSAQQAVGYFYHHGGSIKTGWKGKLAEEFGLKGEVDKDAFKSLMEGQMPDGTDLSPGSKKHLPGVDITFSAPKSFSLESLVSGTDETKKLLTQIHRLAVERAMAEVERRITCRQTVDKTTTQQQTGNLMWAEFEHGTSRRDEANLHSHCVMVNATRDNDGKLRAFDNHTIFRDQKLIGGIYHAELAALCREHGIATREKEGATNGEVELAHISDAQIAEFSTGAAEVEEYLAERGKTRETATAREKEVANLATRESKKEYNPAELEAEWQAKASEVGLAPAKIGPVKSAPMTGREAVGSAIRQLTERDSVVREDEILRVAMSRGVRLEQAKDGLKVLEKEGTAIAGKEKDVTRERDKGRVEIKEGAKVFTTAEAIERDQKFVKTLEQGKGQHASILPQHKVEKALEKANLNPGQRAAAEAILTTNDRFLAIQGVAGAGKTYMLDKVREASKPAGMQFLGLAPTHQAAGELRAVLGEANTVQSFLASPKEWQKLNAKSVVVLDESSLAGSKTMAQLADVVHRQGARLVMVGDTRQFKGVEAGDPFRLAQTHVHTAHMQESVRHSDKDLKAIAAQAAKGQIHESVKGLGQKGGIREIKDDADRYKAMAADYLGKIKGIDKIEERNKTARVLSVTNEARKTLNAHIREGLGLAGKGKTVQVLDATDKTAEELKLLKSYKAGQVLEFQQDYKSLGVAKGDKVEVKEVLADRVRLSNGKDMFPARIAAGKVTQYEKLEIELAKGDAVRMRSNDERWKNGDYGTVKAIGDKNVSIEIKGKTYEMPLQNLQVQHGYAATGHSMQGATTRDVIFEANDRSSYYTNLTRAKESGTAYAKDASRFPEAVAQEREKQNAIEMQQEQRYGR